MPDESSILDVSSEEKGFLPPRISTTARNSINQPAEGLIVYDTDVACLMCYNNSIWVNLCGSGSSGNGSGSGSGTFAPTTAPFLKDVSLTFFGDHVRISDDGTTALVRVQRVVPAVTGYGGYMLYNKEGDEWKRDTIIDTSNPSLAIGSSQLSIVHRGLSEGHAISADGNLIAFVGYRTHNHPLGSSQAHSVIFVHEKINNLWTPIDTFSFYGSSSSFEAINHLNTAGTGGLDYSVQMTNDGSKIFVGSHSNKTDGNSNSGIITVWNRSGNDWTLESEIKIRSAIMLVLVKVFVFQMMEILFFHIH